MTAPSIILVHTRICHLVNVCVSVPGEVRLGGLLMGEGLGAAQAQAGLVSVQYVPYSWTGRTVLTRQRAGFGGRVRHRCCKLQLQFHMLTQLKGEGVG